MKDLKVNDRVQVPHGTATIIGFERFDSKGFSAPMALAQSEWQDERVVCSLDSGHNWSVSEGMSKNYYAYPYEIILLSDIEFEVGQIMLNSKKRFNAMKKEIIEGAK